MKANQVKQIKEDKMIIYGKAIHRKHTKRVAIIVAIFLVSILTIIII
jgi:hypothetical protein